MRILDIILSYFKHILIRILLYIFKIHETIKYFIVYLCKIFYTDTIFTTFLWTDVKSLNITGCPFCIMYGILPRSFVFSE